MTEYREQLVDRMIRLYGFEHELVIEFARLCEAFDNNAWNDRVLMVLVAAHEATPVVDDDEE